MNLYSLLDQAATRFPEKGAVFSGESQVLSFAELRSRALRIAAMLRRDFAVGDRIAILSENRPEYIELLFGIWAAGMVATPLNAKLHAREVLQILEDSAAKSLFVSSKLAREVTQVVAASRVCDCRLILIDHPDYAVLFQDEWCGDIVSSPDALAWLFFTSGTTGRSKGAMLSHRNLMAMTLAHLADMDPIDENCSLLHAAPMSHGSGLYIPAYVMRGARQVVPASMAFEPAEFIELCRFHSECEVFFAPTMVQRLRLEAERSGRLPFNLRTIIYGGGPMYVEELKKCLAMFGQVFVQIYGQGESPMTITGLRRADHSGDDEAILGSVGFSRAGMEVAVVSQEGELLGPGEIGEIICRGDVVMSGYWNDSEATATALKGGWLYTGDLGSFDDRGYLTLRDRSKDLVISGGTNIYPREVEEALLKHPDVVEVCVTGQRHAEWGEIVVAFVVRKPGTIVDDKELDRHCNDHIARFKRPKRYVFVEKLPKNNYGKVLKRELREQLPPIES